MKQVLKLLKLYRINFRTTQDESLKVNLCKEALNPDSEMLWHKVPAGIVGGLHDKLLFEQIPVH